MFQENGRLRLRAYASVQFLVAIFVICAPTAVLLGVIAGRASGSEGAAVLVDASLGGVLVFSSLTAISIPWIYRYFPSNWTMLSSRTVQRFILNAFGKALDRGIIPIVFEVRGVLAKHTAISPLRRKPRCSNTTIIMEVITVLLPTKGRNISGTISFHSWPPVLDQRVGPGYHW